MHESQPCTRTGHWLSVSLSSHPRHLLLECSSTHPKHGVTQARDRGGPLPLRSQPHMHTISVGVESSEEGVLESCVLCRLLQVLVCILPAAEKMCSTPADEAGAIKCCLTSLASAGNLRCFTFHQSRMGSSSSGISQCPPSIARAHASSSSDGFSSSVFSFSTLPRKPPRLT